MKFRKNHPNQRKLIVDKPLAVSSSILKKSISNYSCFNEDIHGYRDHFGED